MAYVINQTAQEYTPAYNPIISVVSDTNYNTDNFQYLCDIYITGKTFAGQNYLRLKTPPAPSGIGIGKGVFDVSKILERYVTFDVGDDIYGFQRASSSLIQYQLKFGSEHGPSSGIITYPNTVVDELRYCWNGLFDFLAFTQFSEFVIDFFIYPDRKMLTDRIEKGLIRQNENAWIYGLVQSSGDIYYAQVETTSNKWMTTNTFRIINQYQAIGNIADRMIRFPAGWNMNNIPVGDFILGTPPVLTGDTQEFKIKFVKYSLAETDTYKEQWFKIDDACTAHDVKRLHFLNKLGGFDSFSFIYASKITADIKRSIFSKPSGKFLTSTSYGYQAKDQTDITFYTELKDTVLLNSNWVDENTLAWLEELITSPVIFLDDATYGLVAVNITDTKYQQKKRLTDKIFNLQISIKFAYNRYRQRQ